MASRPGSPGSGHCRWATLPIPEQKATRPHLAILLASRGQVPWAGSPDSVTTRSTVELWLKERVVPRGKEKRTPDGLQGPPPYKSCHSPHSP